MPVAIVQCALDAIKVISIWITGSLDHWITDWAGVASARLRGRAGACLLQVRGK